MSIAIKSVEIMLKTDLSPSRPIVMGFLVCLPLRFVLYRPDGSQNEVE